MKKNMGSADRIIRVTIAAILAVLVITGVVSNIVGIVLMVVAAIFVLTSVVNFCPIYAVFGKSTCAMKKTEMPD